MTPQEHQLITELFERLSSHEKETRDPEAERAIAEGLRRAPNAAYALVQIALVQDEALKRANDRIQELESALGEDQSSREGFLDSMRRAFAGSDERRGSVPSVRQAGLGSSGVWGAPPRSQQTNEPTNQPMSQGPGSSFLGTAAATAAGVIGGAMLMNGIRSLFGPHMGSSSHSPFDAPGAFGESRSPWDASASQSDLAREAGLNDIEGGNRHASLFGSGDNAEDYPDDNNDMDFDSGDDFGGDDSDTA